MTALYVRCPDCAKALTQFEIDHERCACGVKLQLLEDNDAEAAVALASNSWRAEEEAVERAAFREKVEDYQRKISEGAPYSSVAFMVWGNAPQYMLDVLTEKGLAFERGYNCVTVTFRAV